MKAFILSFLMMVIASSTLLAVMPADASEYTLGIFGNANMDDTIDELDIEYVRGIIAGTNEATKLADANYDGVIDEDDVIQIELIISGEEKELTVIDSADRIVTLNKPVERVITLTDYSAETICIFKAQDKIVGVGSGIETSEVYFPELSKLPVVGSSFNPDFEVILSLHPDLVIQWTSKATENAGNLPGVVLVGLDFYKPETLVEEVKMCGYIFGCRDEANEFIDWYEGYINTINERTKTIPEDDKPRVYLEANYASGDKWKTGGSKSGWHQKIDIAGGNNIFGDIQGGVIDIDPEEVMERNPEIIVKRLNTEESGYAIDDTTEFSDIRDELMCRPELAHVDAVEMERVYIVHIDIFGGFNHLPGIVYLAKWFYPDLFEDLDPQAIHQEYLTRFQGLDYDLDEHGVFVYPPQEMS